LSYSFVDTNSSNVEPQRSQSYWEFSLRTELVEQCICKVTLVIIIIQYELLLVKVAGNNTYNTYNIIYSAHLTLFLISDMVR